MMTMKAKKNYNIVKKKTKTFKVPLKECRYMWPKCKRDENAMAKFITSKSITAKDLHTTVIAQEICMEKIL